MKITKLSIEGKNLRNLAKILKDDIEIRHMSNFYYFHDKNIHIYGEEKFYLRKTTMVTFFIVLNYKNDNECTAEIISAGEAMSLGLGILDPEKGQNKKIIKKLQAICDNNSWRISEI